MDSATMQVFMDRVMEVSKQGIEVVSSCGQKVSEVTTEHILPYINHYVQAAGSEVRATAVKTLELAKSVQHLECMQLRDPDAVAAPKDDQLSFEDLVSVIKMHFKNFPLVGQVLLALTMAQTGLAVNGLFNSFAKEMMKNLGKKRVMFVFVSIYSVFALAGFHFRNALFKNVRKALTDDGPTEAGIVLVRNATRMPSGFWLTAAPGATFAVDFFELWTSTALKKFIRTPIRLRHAALALLLALIIGQARRNEALCERTRAIYSRLVKACFSENTEATTGSVATGEAAGKPDKPEKQESSQQAPAPEFSGGAASSQ